MAGIIISIFVVAALVIFVIMKRRSRKSTTDVEKLDNQPFAPLTSQEVRGIYELFSYVFAAMKYLSCHATPLNFLCFLLFFLFTTDDKYVENSAKAHTKYLETLPMINLKPPPVDLHKTEEDVVSLKPISPPKKVPTVPINAKLYSIADLQVATNSFSVENLVGEGTVGCVYRAQSNDEKVLCVFRNRVVAIFTCEFNNRGVSDVHLFSFLSRTTYILVY